MAEIRIEASDASGSAFEHLYLVFVDDNGHESVIRGGPSGPGSGHLDLQINISMSDSIDYRPIEDRTDRGSRVLDLNGRDPEEVWGILIQLAYSLDSASLTYDTSSLNSNSTVSSLLAGIGIDIEMNLPERPWNIDIYVGEENTLLDDYVRNILAHEAQSNLNLNGGNLDDFIASGSGADLVMGLGGQDQIWLGSNHDVGIGGTASDLIYGQAGHDLILTDELDQNEEDAAIDHAYGGAGNDILIGDSGDGDLLDGGADSDLIIDGSGANSLYGGDGSDYIVSGGGADHIYGGAGNDWINALGNEEGAVVHFDANSGELCPKVGDGVIRRRFDVA